VCCDLKGLEETERERGWPARAGKIVLDLALTRLARHYGILDRDHDAAARVRLRRWGAEDYRPKIS
jgi:hypothetical protein